MAQIHGVPSAPFSMSWIPAMGHANQQLSDALKRLSAAKYGHPRAQVEKEIFARLRPPEAKSTAPGIGIDSAAPKPSSGSSFLDEWLAKRKQLTTQQAVTANNTPTTFGPNDGGKMPAEPAKMSTAIAEPQIGHSGGDDTNRIMDGQVPQGVIQDGIAALATQGDRKEKPTTHFDVRSHSDDDDGVSLKIR